MNKYYRILLTITFFLLFSIKISAQITDSVYVVTLKDTMHRAGHGEIAPLRVVEDYSYLKNIPNVECDLSAIKYFKLNQFVRGDSIQNQIYLFIGADTNKKKKYIKIDANQNYDFSDDKLFELPLMDKPITREEKLEKCFRIPITPRALSTDTAYIGIDPYSYFGNDSPLGLIITFGYYMTTASKIKSIPIEVDAFGFQNLLNKSLSDRNSFLVRYKNLDDSLEYKSFEIGDTVQIQQELFKLTRIKHPDIYFTSIGIAPVTGYVGSFIPDLFAKEINSNEDISLNELMKNKYVFIDFWGSWCNPCISSIPKLKKFYELIKNRSDVLLLGLALENKKDLDKLKGIIKEQELDWPNYWLNRESSKISTSTIKKLSVKSYPTYIIIDNKGKIIHKSRSTYKTDEAISLFLDIINKQ